MMWTWFIAFLVIGFGSGILLVWLAFEKSNVGKYAYIKGFHFHHTLYGLASIILAWFESSYAAQLVGFGLGIILHDVRTERALYFVTREPRP